MNTLKIIKLVIKLIVVIYLWYMWIKKIRKTKVKKPKKRTLDKHVKFHNEVVNRKNPQNLEKICNKLIKDIPEEKEYLEESIKFNGELLGHVYFEDDFTKHLVKLLEENKDITKIQKYCNFIEYMWRNGDEDVVNIFDVSIAESLATYKTEWKTFGKYISNELIQYINEILIPLNILMCSAELLEKNRE